jgi:hypothetical protein
MLAYWALIDSISLSVETRLTCTMMAVVGQWVFRKSERGIEERRKLRKSRMRHLLGSAVAQNYAAWLL